VPIIRPNLAITHGNTRITPPCRVLTFLTGISHTHGNTGGNPTFPTGIFRSSGCENGCNSLIYSSRVLKIQACFDRGCETCRSPPVSFLRPIFTVLHIPGMKRSEPSSHPDQQLSRMCRTGGPGPRERALLTLTLNDALLPPAFPQRSDGGSKKHLFAQTSLTFGIYRGETLRLSNLSNILTRRAE